MDGRNPASAYQAVPHCDPDDLRKAHAFAYGGPLVQDMGYYPFGSIYFSDPTHYVRSGDFIVNLIHESSDLNEYAFALGALAHYSADNLGHPAVNEAVAMEFPKLRKKFGNEVTYADNPKAHIRTEFGFDVSQVARNRYTSDRYHDFIGFEISQAGAGARLRGDVRHTTQCRDLRRNLAIGTFGARSAKVVPEMTRVALLAQEKKNWSARLPT